MIIYKDIFSGDELFSDTYPMELVDGVVYKVKGKMKTEIHTIDESALGANASAEEAAEGTDASSTSGVDIVINGRLIEYGLGKKEYMGFIKEYMKRVKDKLAEDQPGEVDTFQTNVQKFIKGVIGNFKEWQFYTGESNNPDGMLSLMMWDGETPYMYFYKHGLDAEKV